MTGQMGFWSITERLAEISAQGDPLETLAATVDFEMFRPVLEGALGRPPRWKGGRSAFDPVLKFRMLVLQSLHGLSLEQTEYLVRDRLSWMRLGPARSRGSGAGCEHPVGLPRSSDRSRRARRSVRAARPGDHDGGLLAARWATRGGSGNLNRGYEWMIRARSA